MKASYAFVALFLILGTLLHPAESEGEEFACKTTKDCVEGGEGHGPLPGTCCVIDEANEPGACISNEARNCLPK